MRFIDEVEIYVKAGDGGNGCIAFRREAHVPRGGPSGGDGGRGGDIVVEATRNVSTLLDHRYQRHYKAERGKAGQGADCHGRAGVERVITVPCGTLVADAETGEIVADLVDDGQRAVAARGGAGGRGNARFSTPTNRAPREAEDGEEGQERKLRLELKLLAEVGLVGLPSAGKSTLISRVSKAKPKIADYHFTTLVPNLGMVRLPGMGDRSFVMADIPGLIEGAADGAGLGHRFLKHVERTAVLIYLLDDRHQDIGEEGQPADDLEVLRKELEAYSETLAAKPSLIVLNKVDSIVDERLTEVQATLRERATQWPVALAQVEQDPPQDVSHTPAPLPPPPALSISAVTGQGLDELLEAIWPIVAAAREARQEIDWDTPPVTPDRR